MRHLILIFSSFVLTLSLLGCKTSTVHVPVDPYVNVNIDYVVENCTPTENYSFPVFGVYAMPARAKDCAGVEDLWIVRWPGENTEIEKTTAKLLTLLYVKSLHDEKGLNYTSLFIKYDSTMSKDSSHPMHASFYELKEVKPEVDNKNSNNNP